MASQNGHVKVVTMLLQANATVDQAADNGATPLYIACEIGHTEIVTMLIAATASVNQVRDNGDTPLIFCCQNGHTEVVTTLIAANADVNHADNDGRTLLHRLPSGLHRGRHGTARCERRREPGHPPSASHWPAAV